MIEIIKERKVRVEKEYWINFDCKDDPSCGFIFPANSDESPALDRMPDEARYNYFQCEMNFDKYDRWFEERNVTVVEPAIGRCACGAEVELESYSREGALKCDNCGRWYNTFGQNLVDPIYWTEDDEDYYDPADDYWD